MRMDNVANSGNDEYYTPRYAVMPITKYIEPKSRIWCPFDTPDSLFVRILTGMGHEVFCSHIDDGMDFFDHTTCALPDDTHYIISNPPYSKKGEVFKRLFWLGVPFAMLVGVVGLFESRFRFNMFKNNDFEIMYLNKRVSYFKDYEDQRPSLNPPFSSVYICSQMLPQQIVFEEIDKKDLSAGLFA